MNSFESFELNSFIQIQSRFMMQNHMCLKIYTLSNKIKPNESD
jgi:hypothetical protein